MATSTLRFAIIVALVVGGIVLISRAFPEGATSALSGSGGEASTSASPSSSPSTKPRQTPGAPVKGVVLAVYNGTGALGLAGSTADALTKPRYGYKVPSADIGNAPSSSIETTTVFYVTSADKPAAEALANGFFKQLTVKIQKWPGSSKAPTGVQVVVYLGTDYAALQG